MTGKDHSLSIPVSLQAGARWLLVRDEAKNGGMTAQRYGIPIGAGPDGRVSRMPGNSVGVGKHGRARELGTKADDKMAGNQQLLTALKAKQLPDKVTKDEVAGIFVLPSGWKAQAKEPGDSLSRSGRPSGPGIRALK